MILVHGKVKGCWKDLLKALVAKCQISACQQQDLEILPEAEGKKIYDQNGQ
ncbi:hypothetical protein [Anaerotignum sp.]|uniref:hypothetical protein n=1 Tax=Anaerotignum sp. TaxID=2039241 RepID=UPI003734D3D9